MFAENKVDGFNAHVRKSGNEFWESLQISDNLL